MAQNSQISAITIANIEALTANYVAAIKEELNPTPDYTIEFDYRGAIRPYNGNVGNLKWSGELLIDDVNYYFEVGVWMTAEGEVDSTHSLDLHQFLHGRYRRLSTDDYRVLPFDYIDIRNHLEDNFCFDREEIEECYQEYLQ